MLETANIVLDFMLIIAAVWMLYVVRRSTLGGRIGNTLLFITIGTLLLGFAHMLETITFEFLQLDLAMVEFIHRVIVMAGFVLLTLGFRPIAQLAQNTD